MLIRQLEQVLIHTSARLGHHPVSAQTDVIEFLGQITQLVDDDVHLIGINAQGLIVGLVMIGASLLSHHHEHRANLHHYLVVGLAVENLDYSTVQHYRRSIAVVHSGSHLAADMAALTDFLGLSHHLGTGYSGIH